MNTFCKIAIIIALIAAVFGGLTFLKPTRKSPTDLVLIHQFVTKSVADDMFLQKEKLKFDSLSVVVDDIAPDKEIAFGTVGYGLGPENFIEKKFELHYRVSNTGELKLDKLEIKE